MTMWDRTALMNGLAGVLYAVAKNADDLETLERYRR